MHAQTMEPIGLFEQKKSTPWGLWIFRILTALFWGFFFTMVFIEISGGDFLIFPRWAQILTCVPIFLLLAFFLRNQGVLFLAFFNVGFTLIVMILRFYLIVAPTLPL